MGIIGSIYFHNSHKLEYLTARVDRSDIQTTVTTTGNLNAVVTVQVGSQVSGNIIALYADFNTKVKKGQLVALIDPAPFKAAVEQAKASLAAAKSAVVTVQATVAKSQSDVASALANVASQKANLAKSQSAVDLAKVENERRKVLLKQNATSQEDADTAQAAYDQAVAVVDAARAALNGRPSVRGVRRSTGRGGAHAARPSQCRCGSGRRNARASATQPRSHQNRRACEWHSAVPEHGCRTDRGRFIPVPNNFSHRAGPDEDAG